MNETVAGPDIDLSSPLQFSQRTWKGPVWYGIATFAPWCAAAFFIFIGLVVLAEKRDAQFAPALFLVALLCMLTVIPLRRLGKWTVNGGIDRKTNTFWIRNERSLVYEKNADRITEFGVQRYVHTKMNPAWKIGGPQPLIFKNYKWLLTYKRAGNNYFWEFRGGGFATEKDAEAVAQKAGELLGRART